MIRLSQIKNFYFSPNKRFVRKIKSICGTTPIDLNLYERAFTHRSASQETAQGRKVNNERLEFLGDAVLDLVIAEELFTKYPKEEEGFLTQMRSKIVNTKMLNQLGSKLGFEDMVVLDERNKTIRSFNKGMMADTVEAFIGAIYMDQGYTVVKSFICNKIMEHHIDLDELIETSVNHKSVIYEWAQKNNFEISFEVVDIVKKGPRKQFVSQLFIDGRPATKGMDFSKKAAEQSAAELYIKKMQ